MPLYEFRCPEVTVVEAAYSMAAVPDTMDCTDCTDCATPAARRITSMRLSRAGSSAYRLIESTQRSASTCASWTSSTSAPIPQEDSGPLAGQGWGYTGIFAKNNGGGFLTDQFPDAYKTVWDFNGQVATLRHVPGVHFEGLVHPGLIGTAPSAELLATWNTREVDLIATELNRVPPLALLPESEDAVLGGLDRGEWQRVGAEAARTAPLREDGGNQDIKNLSKCTRVFYPVFVNGAHRGPALGCGQHPELVLHRLPHDGDVRLRRAPHLRRAALDRPGHRRPESGERPGGPREHDRRGPPRRFRTTR